jgi:hypothetical protein
MRAVFRLDEVEAIKNEEGMFCYVPFGKRYLTYHRLLNQEIARHCPRISQSEKRNVAKQIMATARDQPDPPLLQLSNSLAKQLERYTLADGRPRLAIEEDFVERFWTEYKPNHDFPGRNDCVVRDGVCTSRREDDDGGVGECLL